MTLQEFDSFTHQYFNSASFDAIDYSRNGIQVERRNQTIKKVACAVDACMDSFIQASEWGADLLFVHHGLIWGSLPPLRGMTYERISYLIDKDLCLYACHLPLDAHKECGNNWLIAQALGLKNKKDFGLYKDRPIGVKGTFSSPLSVEEIASFFKSTLAVLSFSQKKVETVGIISGGAPKHIEEAIEEGLDAYITGDASHNEYHRCKECSMNAIFAGHYETEIWGVRQYAQVLREKTDIDAQFFNIPTNL